MCSSKLAEEIKQQLETGIISYVWLLQVTERHFPDESFDNRKAFLVASLKSLLESSDIVIGPTEPRNGSVCIRNWGGSPESSITKVEDYISSNGEPGSNHDVAFGFWIGLPTYSADY